MGKKSEKKIFKLISTPNLIFFVIPTINLMLLRSLDIELGRELVMLTLFKKVRMAHRDLEPKK